MFLLKKLSFWIAVAGFILAAVLISIIGKEKPKFVPVAMPSVNPYLHAIAASGIVESYDRNIAVAAPLSGLVVEVYRLVGDKVEKNDALFKLDTRDLEARAQVQAATIDVSKAQNRRLQDQLDRFKSIKDQRAVSVEEVRTRENDVLVSQAQIKAAESELQETHQLIERLTVRSPIDGMVLQSNIRKGEYVLANMDPSPFLLGNTTQLQVRVDIDEQNASRFETSDPAFAYPKNNTTLRIPLKFSRVEPYVIPKRSLTGASDERVDTRVLQVIYTFTQPENFHVWVGQQVDVFIEDSHGD